MVTPAPVPPPIPPPRFSPWRGRVLAIGLATVTIGAVLWILLRPPEFRHWWPQCAFYRWTGLLCPGCGGTRAFQALRGGEFLYAMRCNGFTTLLLPFLPVLIGRWAYKLWTQSPGSTLSGLIKPWWLYAIAAGLVIFVVLRNIPSPVFDFLRPM